MNIEYTVALLQAQQALRENLATPETEQDASSPASADATPIALPRRIFVVHGHDDGAREAVAGFLEKIGFEPVILHEQASQNRTVIEKSRLIKMLVSRSCF